MSKAPSVLVLDDGELGRVIRLLERLGADFAHLSGDQIGESVDSPRDLLVTTGQRALEMPAIVRPDGAQQPTWVVIHGHDLEGLRERLRRLGVHFLVHSALDQTSLGLLVEQVLYKQADRRQAVRLPLGVEVSYRMGNELDKAKLRELSLRGCRILTPDELHPDSRVAVQLPRELVEDAKVVLPGRVVRRAPHEPQPGMRWHSSVVIFDELDDDASAHLAKIFSGERMGTRVTPLEMSPGTQELELGSHDKDRRCAPRHTYNKRMALLAAVGVEVPQVMLGRDLSKTGLRIERYPGLRLGMHIAIALYGSPRSEPIVVQAEVVADHGERGLGLEFKCMGDHQNKALDALFAQLPPVQQLCAVVEGDHLGPEERVVLSEIVEAPGR